MIVFKNEGGQNIHILGPGEDFQPGDPPGGNRLINGQTRGFETDLAVGEGIFFRAGRNGEVLATITCVYQGLDSDSPRVVWNGSSLACEDWDLSPTPRTLVVNENDDTSDHDVEDGTCDVDPDEEDDQCTLRAALEVINHDATEGRTEQREVVFDMPNEVIEVAGNLPTIGVSVLLVGTTQDEGVVELDGSGVGGDGLHLRGAAGESSIEGFIIHSFGGDGIELNGVADVTVKQTTIGRRQDESEAGVGGHSIYLNQANNAIVDGNTLWNSDGSGVFINGGSANAILQNNIALNGEGGVVVDASTQNRILGNSINLNEGLGIDLGGDEVTDNDAGDGDSGANRQQNFPVLSSVLGGGFRVFLDGAVSKTYTIELFGSAACDDSGHGEGTFPLHSETVTTDGSGEATFTFTPGGTYAVYTATATDAEGNTSEFSRCVEAMDAIVVNSVGDGEDAEAGDGVCDTGATIERDDQEEVECTLRAAIQTANNPGTGKAAMEIVRITFDVPGAGVPTITPGEDLPAIEAPVILDGTTQAAGSVNVLSSNLVVGIDIRAAGSGSTVKGFIVARFVFGIRVAGASDTVLEQNTLTGNGAGIRIEGNDELGLSARTIVRNNVTGGNVGPGISLSDQVTATSIENNFIGTERDGVSPLPNSQGIRFDGGPQQTTIRNNLISGNHDQGIFNGGFERGFPSGVVIEANRMGTDLTATTALPNGKDALVLFGVTGAEVYNNIMAGHQGAGLRLHGVSNSIIEGNYIGTNTEAASNLGNSGHGIFVEQGRNIRIDGNIVASNGAGQSEDGIHITYATDIQVRRNGIGVFLPPDENLNAIVPRGNARCGVFANHTTNLRIEENIIADNGADGVCESNGKGTTVISENLIGVKESVAGPVGNRGHGISLTNVGEGEVTQNIIVFNGKDGLSLLDAEEVIVLFNVVADNNQAGVRAEEVAELIMEGNSILGNLGLGTGIHLTASHAVIDGNTITDDAGDAITLEDGSTAVVNGNNIFGNAGMGLNNLTPSVMITASGNWWGDASGPGGEGPGSGDAISAGVDATGWLGEMVAIVLAAEADEILLPTGEVDTVSVFFQNWQGRTDALDLTITDTEGWLQSTDALTVSLNDTTGAAAFLAFAVPTSTPEGTTSTVEVTATSQADASHTATTTFTLIAEGAALAQVFVVPRIVNIAPGDTVRFDAVGLDQFSRTVEIMPTWTATGGEIDEDGIYVAGEATGEFIVTATDPATGLSGTAQVGNGVSVAVEAGAEVPEAFHLAPNYPNPFNPETAIPFTVPQQAHVRLVVYDMLGREVMVLVDAVWPAGTHTARFDARTLPSGIYLYRMQAGSFRQTRAMVLLR